MIAREHSVVPLKGIYVLFIRLTRSTTLCVGAIGERKFKEGVYAYVGSAQTNLEKRLERHLRREKKLFWHIDYLLNSPYARIEKTLFASADKSAECIVAGQLAKQGEDVRGFGCSDCKCRSHLFRIGGDPE